MSTRLMGVGAALAGTAVLAGAFGAHAFDTMMSADRAALYDQAALYHLAHGVAIVGIAGGMSHFDRARLAIACWMLAAGTLLFSGALYAVALLDDGGMGAVAPIGGTLLILGWAMVVAGARKLPRKQ